VKPLRLRPAARGDALAVAAHYRDDSGLGIALAFTDALQRALHSILENPDIGAPGYAHILDVPGLRVLSLRRFPLLVAYRETRTDIDVLRILHAKRDVPPSLRPRT
jgi:toxin ParE1/3/4